MVASGLVRWQQVRRPVYTSSVGRWRAYGSSADTAEAEGFPGLPLRADLDAMGALGPFPAAAVLARVAHFEPPGGAADLSRPLPCAPRTQEAETSGDSGDARWPEGGEFERI
jgi:hypothetical protein